MGIELLDHVIVSRETYFSFLEHKMLKKGQNKESDVRKNIGERENEEEDFDEEYDEEINTDWNEYYAAAEFEKY